jgi:hypothetical protein
MDDPMSEQPEERALVCIEWDKRSGIVDSVQRNCSNCSVAVAVDKANAKRIEGGFHMTILCIHCVLKVATPEEIGNAKSMVGGKTLEHEQAIDKVKDLIKHFGEN